MAKRITFLLVMICVLLIGTVMAYAGTETTTPEAGFTQDEADFLKEISLIEKTYGDIFFDEDSESDVEIISVTFQRAYSIEKELRHSFTGSVIDSSSDVNNYVVMLMYIKVDGEYVPLKDIDTGKNAARGPVMTNSTVDLKYLGSDKVNEVRIISFKKNDSKNLQLNQNLQITDYDITVRPWNLIEKINITYNEIKNNLTTN